ncbi:ABC transporter ATP-binding protein [Glycomyces arizonensis]|uniref:ABC transporter ATP-binding protein n=1 Tax=Glycomyces arizonensis TaxID=256035 RepID=UPI00041352CE|nr:ABC transporter ATP-binding protein [Glycomyces arizonensis]
MALQVEDLRVHYRTMRGDVRALDGVSFGLEDGEIMGLAGESGCGKTTLGKSLIRLDGRMRHVGGTAVLDGEELPINDDKAMNARRFNDVSIIPQYSMSAMNPTRKIGKLTADLLRAKGKSYREVKPELVRRLELVGLSEKVLDNYPIELSGGMKQRMVMVLSTLLDPSLLIADEVTSALDVSNQKAVAETLVRFRDLGFVKSMIVVTHDLSLVYQIADTIMIMYAGQVVEKAPADTIIKSPSHPYTQALIGALPEVGLEYGDKRLKSIPGKPPQLLNPPTGCRFRARCPLAHDRCAEEPPAVQIADDHVASCWKVES